MIPSRARVHSSAWLRNPTARATSSVYSICWGTPPNGLRPATATRGRKMAVRPSADRTGHRRLQPIEPCRPAGAIADARVSMLQLMTRLAAPRRRTRCARIASNLPEHTVPRSNNKDRYADISLAPFPELPPPYARARLEPPIGTGHAEIIPSIATRLTEVGARARPLYSDRPVMGAALSGDVYKSPQAFAASTHFWHKHCCSVVRGRLLDHRCVKQRCGRRRRRWRGF